MDRPRVQHPRGRGAGARAGGRYARVARPGTAGRPLHPEGARRRAPPGGSSRGGCRRGLGRTSAARSTATRPRSCSPRSASRCCRPTACTTPTRPWPRRSGSAGRWPSRRPSPALRHRADLGGVRLDIADEAELRADVAQVLALAVGARGDRRRRPLEVQAMAPHGSACVVRSVEDPLFGPIVSFGLAGDASDLLGDVAYGVPPADRRRRLRPRPHGARGAAAVRLPRAAGARRRRARGRHRARLGAGGRPAGAAARWS